MFKVHWYNPYLFIHVCYPCICKYFRIKICLNQCSQYQSNVHHVNSKKGETTAVNGSVCKKVDLLINTLSTTYKLVHTYKTLYTLNNPGLTLNGPNALTNSSLLQSLNPHIIK